MRKPLYQIDQEYILLMEQLEEAGGILDESLERKLEISETELATKAEKYCMIIKEIEARVATRKAEIDRMAKLSKTDQNIITRLKEALSNSMNLHEKTKLEGDLFVIGFRKSTKTEQTGEGDPLEFLPKKFIKLTKSVNTKLIGEALSEGTKVKGFARVEHKNISIR